jgi:hypothetical protein
MYIYYYFIYVLLHYIEAVEAGGLTTETPVESTSHNYATSWLVTILLTQTLVGVPHHRIT